MYVYKSWTRNCESKPGLVKVLSKPMHGTIAPTVVAAKIGVSRVAPQKTAHCQGAPTEGFRVDYTSEPGFRGSDHFTLQFSYGKHTDIDNYTVNVF
jgi:hypothetical protein